MATKDPLRYFVQLGAELHEVRELEGHEKMSATFRFEARFQADTALGLDPDALVKSEAHILLMRDGELVRQIDGIVTDLSLGASIRGGNEVEVVIEPRLSLARFRTDIRVFRNMTVPEIVTDTLSQIGVTPQLRLAGSYKRRPYCVQWREADLDFVHRLLEDEGIHYFFLPGDIMVLGDRPSAYEPMAAGLVPYRAASALDGHRNAVISIGQRASLTVGKVTLRDWNPEHPSLDMDVEAAGPTPAGPEYYDYPGEYELPPEGARKAQLRSEAFATNAANYEGVTTQGAFAPGFTFKLVDAPVATYNGGFVVLSVEHAYRRDGSFSLEFGALREDVTYRPPLVTYVPVILNPQTGFVTTPPGNDDIHTEEYGRVKIHFHWDRRMPMDDNCSHWIPTLQDNTGQSSAIPRRDWEMLVHFMEGDPDRPVVLGRVYNAEDRFPVPLPTRKFCTSLKSLSTPTRDGTNEIQIDDESGKEYIMIHAEKDENIVVANDKTETILLHESSVVRHNESITIGVNHTFDIASDLVPSIQGDQTWSTGGNRTRETSEAESTSVKANREVKIGAIHKLEVDDSSVTTAKELKEQIGGVVLEMTDKSNATEVGENGKRTIGGACIELADETKAETTTKKRVENVAGILFQKAKGEIKIKAGEKRKTKVGVLLSVDADKHINISGAEELHMESGTATHEGSKTLTLKVQDTSILLKDGLLKIDAKKTISLEVTGKNNQGSGKSDQI
jgi:type VI secretion system secreted protein VgrG